MAQPVVNVPLEQGKREVDIVAFSDNLKLIHTRAAFTMCNNQMADKEGKDAILGPACLDSLH